MSSTRPDLKFSDTADERLFYRKFSNLPPKENALVVRIIDHKDYFSALAEDAELIADAIYKTQLVIKTHQGHRHVTISPQVFASVARFCLLENSHKLEIYNKQLTLIATATPGNLDALAKEYGVDLESMLQDGLTPVVAAVKFSTGASRKVGVSMVDLLNRIIRVSEFEDNDLFSNLESLLLQVNVKEVIVPSNYSADDQSTTSSEVVKLFQTFNKIGLIVVGSVKLSAFSATNIEQDLAKLVVSDNVDSDNIELVLASKAISSSEDVLSLSCCNALIQYLGLLGDDVLSYSLDKYSLSKYMKMDASTTRALNIFPMQSAPLLHSQTSSSVSSIYDLLNKCKSAPGTRLLSQWLKQPLTDSDEIQLRHQLVEHLIEDTSLRVFLTQEWLAGVPDTKKLLKKISNGLRKVSGSENKKLEDVVRLYQLVVAIPELVNMLQMSADDASAGVVKEMIETNWLGPIKLDHEKLVKYQELVETTIDLSPLTSASAYDLLHKDFNIKPEFDELLVEIDNNLQDTSRKIKQIHEQVGDDLGIDTEKKLKLEKHQQHGWCLRVTRTDSAILRNTGDRYIELQTVKAGVFFTTKKLRSLSQQYLDFSAEYNAKQKELIKEILSITLTYQTVFLRMSLVISTIDVLNSFANVAIFAPVPFVKPKLHPLASSRDSPEFLQRTVKLKEARHPVIEVQDDVSFIPNDVTLANEQGKPFVIITGPNMGGKSTYIRQVGVIALMNQIGSFVPAELGAELPIFDAILSRVGAGDSQLKGLSTFMIEMLETSSILATATHNSLIIIDELGRGTSTYDGFGLAWSISEHLITSKRCFTLFATHFHELTKLSETHEGKVQNLHVVAHIDQQVDGDKREDDITLLYKVEPGVSDKSFGIHVAELVKFPAKIINMAKRKASELQSLNVTEVDPYVESKRTKCLTEEISVGVEKLKSLLLEWKSQCVDKSTGECSISSGVAVAKLKELLDSSPEVKSDKFVEEVLTLL